MVSERTLVALTPAQHADEVAVHKLHDWINHSPIIQYSRDDLTGDPAVDMPRMLQAAIDAKLADMMRNVGIVPWIHNDGAECHCKGSCRGSA